MEYISAMAVTTRLQKFKHWPAALPYTPIQLSTHGFIYSGVGDRILCSLCCTVLSDLSKAWVPKHKNENCPCMVAICMLKEMLLYENRVISLQATNSPRRETRRMAQDGFYYQDGLRYVTYKNMSLFKIRLETFNGKSIDNSREIARKGFIHSGVDAQLVHMSACDIVPQAMESSESSSIICKVCYDGPLEVVFSHVAMHVLARDVDSCYALVVCVENQYKAPRLLRELPNARI
uniref:E3 ubiquitin-protein ligase XIAP-like n=1 Tax=Diabrotica virgifera virgifera TaxID=50390 RepID=A0A6P7GKF6_DIAVI